MPILGDLTKEFFELVYVHGEEHWENAGVLFLSANATIFFFDKELSDECYPCVLSSQCEYCLFDWDAV